jgi:response regulator RpfG family c-di-GMP phosphodiesterase
MDERQTILLVDDEKMNLMLLSGELSKNYRILISRSGPQALKTAEESTPDLILLDILLGDMDGYEVCRQLKKNPKTEAIPVIFLTGKTAADDIVRGFVLGAVDYISKPFNMVELFARVKTHLFLRKTLKTQGELIEKLEESLKQVKQLSGLIPICSYCKKIRDDKGYWSQVEEYISNHSDAMFTHGMCPDCLNKLYPDLGNAGEKEG